MKQLIILHGSGGTSNDHWFPYLRSHFEEKGWEVVVPDMPGTDDPQLVDQLSFVQENLTLTSETVLVAGLYNAARPEFNELSYLQTSYDWQKIKGQCDQFIFLHSTNDPWDCDEQEADFAFKQLGGTKIMMENMGHFGSDTHNMPCKELPILVKLIED